MTYETQTHDTWQWWAGSCEELYTDGPFDTREDAVYVVKTNFATKVVGSLKALSTHLI